MEANIYLIIVVIIVVLIYVFLTKKGNIKKTNDLGYDLIITFKEDKYTDIRKIKEFRAVDDWHEYSSHGFRGFCKLSKEELVVFIQNKLQLELDDFKVINGNPGLYIPS